MLFRGRPAQPGAIAFIDAIYCALIDAGVPDAEVPRLERLASTFVLGFAVSESSGRFADAARAARGASLPGHRKLQSELARDVDWSAEFDADLSDLIDLVRTRSAFHRRVRPRRRRSWWARRIALTTPDGRGLAASQLEGGNGI